MAKRLSVHFTETMGGRPVCVSPQSILSHYQTTQRKSGVTCFPCKQIVLADVATDEHGQSMSEPRMASMFDRDE